MEWAIDVCRLPLLGCRWRWRVVTSQRWRKSVPALAGMGDLRLERRVELRWERRARVSEMVWRGWRGRAAVRAEMAARAGGRGMERWRR